MWKWLRGEETSQSDIADPTQEASYSFCVYAGEAPALMAGATVLPDAIKWAPIGDMGYKYKDKNGAAAGLQRLVLKGGGPGPIEDSTQGQRIRSSGHNTTDRAPGHRPSW